MSMLARTPLFVCVSLLALLPQPAIAARHWFTADNRVLLNTDLFEVSVGENDYCDPAKRDWQLMLYLRFSTDEVEIGENPRYRSIVETQVAPTVETICGEVTDLVVHNFFSHRFDNPKGNEVPVSRATFRNLLVDTYPAQVQWVWFDAIYAGEFPPSGDDDFGDNSLTTVGAIRAWLAQGSPEDRIVEFKGDQERASDLQGDSQADGRDGGSAIPQGDESAPCGPIAEPYASEEFGAARYALAHYCLHTFSPQEQLFVAGVASGIFNTCEHPVPPGDRPSVSRFLSASSFVAVGGRERDNPSLGVYFEDIATSMASYLTGAAWIKAIGCENPLIPVLAVGIVVYLQHTAGAEHSEGERFVDGCLAHYDGRYTKEQCRCAADVGRALLPDLHQREFSVELLRSLIKRNPIVGGQATLGCGILRY